MSWRHKWRHPPPKICLHMLQGQVVIKQRVVYSLLRCHVRKECANVLGHLHHVIDLRVHLSHLFGRLVVLLLEQVEPTEHARHVLLLLVTTFNDDGLFDRQPIDLLLLDVVAAVRLEAGEVDRILLLEVEAEEDVVPHVVVLLDMRLEIEANLLKVLAVDIADEARVGALVEDHIVLGAQLGERVDDDTADDSREDEHHRNVVEEVEQEAKGDVAVVDVPEAARREVCRLLEEGVGEGGRLAEAVVPVEEGVEQERGGAERVGGLVEDRLVVAEDGHGEREDGEVVDEDEDEHERREHLHQVLFEHLGDVEHGGHALHDVEQVDAREVVRIEERQRRRDHEEDVFERERVGEQQVDGVVDLERPHDDLLAAHHRGHLHLERRRRARRLGLGVAHKGELVRHAALLAQILQARRHVQHEVGDRVGDRLEAHRDPQDDRRHAERQVARDRVILVDVGRVDGEEHDNVEHEGGDRRNPVEHEVAARERLHNVAEDEAKVAGAAPGAQAVLELVRQLAQVELVAQHGDELVGAQPKVFELLLGVVALHLLQDLLLLLLDVVLGPHQLHKLGHLEVHLAEVAVAVEDLDRADRADDLLALGFGPSAEGLAQRRR
mmetsp:Transcript_46346/g.136909  ORF Transcript_46346/g.136909 Transcript_46346/m.136909 type:complete len:609 (+) Transcript_46346:396-2222(+)